MPAQLSRAATPYRSAIFAHPRVQGALHFDGCLQRRRVVAKVPAGVGPQQPQVVVLVGATGDLARRKLLPGLFHLVSSGFIPGCRIIGVSLEDLDSDGFRKLARDALTEFSARKVTQADWDAFAGSLHYVPLTAGAATLKAAQHAVVGGPPARSLLRAGDLINTPPARACPRAPPVGSSARDARAAAARSAPWASRRREIASTDGR